MSEIRERIDSLALATKLARMLKSIDGLRLVFRANSKGSLIRLLSKNPLVWGAKSTHTKTSLCVEKSKGEP